MSPKIKTPPKNVVSTRLTREAEDYCRQHEIGFSILETVLRRSKGFRQWLARKGGGK